jgi:two-component system, cell cycle sensor histidine kinase and response regulator CckA
MEKQLRVLFVEDSEIDTELICSELRRGGYSVHFKRVETETEFLPALREDTWDLIISDFSMPHFDGIKAFDLFSEQGFDIPFIFVSGEMGEERAVRAMKAGARDYILKGQLGRLNAAVQRELQEARGRRAQRRAEAEKLREQKRLAVALRATGAGVFEYSIPPDESGYCNERFGEIFGLTLGELPPFSLLPGWIVEQIHPEDRPGVVERQQDFIAGRSNEFAREYRVRHKDGNWREISCVMHAVNRCADGAVADLVGVLIDRTDEKRMEQQFRQAQKMEAIGRLAGGIAHDFNNLLTVISNFGEFVMQHLEPGTEVHDDMQEVMKAAGRAETLTGQLLAYSRHRPVLATVLNANELVFDVDKMLRRLVGPSIDFKMELATDLWRVRIDAGGLEQVLVNLAVNARDAMPDGGRLCIETSNETVGEEYIASKGIDVPPGQYVSVTITDSGVGMDAAIQSRLFEPFFTTKEPGKGTGLGLATCYGIVKQAKGFIWVYSEPGHGSSFRLLLPRELAPEDTIAEPTYSEKLRGNETILVVEDDEPVRKLVVRLLSMLGYSVLEAMDVADALRTADTSRSPIHAVITDVVMPETHGPEFVRKLAVSHPDIRTVYMSGYTRGSIEMDESIVLVQKPFAPKDLARKVREVLDRPA